MAPLSPYCPVRSDGGRAKPRLAAPRENLLQRLIEKIYLTSQKRSAAELVRAIHRHAEQVGVQPPSESTIRRRLKRLPLSECRRRGDAYPQTQPVDGRTPPAEAPLDWVQIDHTPVDVIVVDPIDRVPTGRPYLTVAIDKAPWLQQRGIEARWPLVGKPRRLGADNAAEFHAAAFERGCAQHAIAIEWRPPGRPHFGGIVERVIGTLMQLVHALPGTTFSNPAQRGAYNSDKTACLTLQELERWLAVAISKYYHLRPHQGLDGETPLQRCEQGLQALAAAGKTVPTPRDPRAFLIDFLPVVHRSLQRDGITIDHITYYSNALRPWIQRRNWPVRLLIRRDPRDLSRIFVLDTDDNAYLEVPYRTLCRVRRSRCGSISLHASGCASSGTPRWTRRVCLPPSTSCARLSARPVPSHARLAATGRGAKRPPCPRSVPTRVRRR